MNIQNIPTGRSIKKELQGPRPTPLRINKDSHKIKKPPLVPQPSQPKAPPRQPTIIYLVSPKVIHTTPGDFMSLVQRLTGCSSSFSSSSSNKVSSDPLNDNNGYKTTSQATIEKDRSITPQGVKRHQSGNSGGDVRVVEQPSFLSPGPALMSHFPSSFFSPPSSDQSMSMVSFFHDMSPVVHGHRNFMEGSFVMSNPSDFVSPLTPSIDLFNNFLD